MFFFSLSCSLQEREKNGTHHWGIAEAFHSLEDTSTNHPHGEGTTTVIHNPPGAARRKVTTSEQDVPAESAEKLNRKADSTIILGEGESRDGKMRKTTLRWQILM